jgi:hypothetical protein
MIRNYIEQDDAMREAGAIVVPTPGDPLAIWILQPGANHLIVQINRAEMVIS